MPVCLYLHGRGGDHRAVFAAAKRLTGIPVRIDCGSDDGFAGAARAFLAVAPPSTSGGIEDGCHDPAFWRSAACAQLTAIAHHLA
jgi:hypothetical protein